MNKQNKKIAQEKRRIEREKAEKKAITIYTHSSKSINKIQRNRKKRQTANKSIFPDS